MLTFKKFPAEEPPEGVPPGDKLKHRSCIHSNRLLYFVSCRYGVGQRI